MPEQDTAPAAPGCPAVSSRTLFRTVEYPNLPILLQRTGSPDFAELRTAGLNGMYLADQALHSGALLVSALLITRL
ncbi:hypothetical protein LN042_34260 [Kitasatospora sp. RB6PN24]|uniref:hypothetical protein n=1 Tax=Kitasatospora humi TaxID=2893891 RepID=UPI001E46D816|nr:hypothetical protein [Kitasatospora humi]MCC9312066.1 hypothetical protein [Kitasatospora humi]